LEGYDAIAYYDADCEFQVRIVGNQLETMGNQGKHHWNMMEDV